MLRKHKKLLQQIIKHCEEICINDKIKFINCSHNTFSVNKPDCFVLTNEGQIIQIVEILLDFVVGLSFNSNEDLFEKPMKFSKLKFIIKNWSESTKMWCITDIKKKMIIFHVDGV